jgi:CubicO group peptidase (beta-lactamase class C family)
MSTTRVWAVRVIAGSVLLAGLASAQTAPPPSPVDAALAAIDARIAEAYGKDNVGSVTAGVVVGPKLVWTRSYGFADMGSRKPAGRDSVYRIGSVTKQFTALALLQLAERGKLRLTDPVETHVPELRQVPLLRPDQPKITLLQLATMTSGLAREPAGPPDHSQGPVADWEKKVMASIPHVRFAHEPGTRFLYCNIGYAILGVAVGRAAGQPFTEYVGEHLLAPLGMTRTAFEPTGALRTQAARGYEIDGEKVDGERSVVELDGRGYRVPNGALFSTVEDLARFVSWQLGEGPAGILKKETLEDNFRRVYSADGDLRSGYGVGFDVARRRELVAHGHGGSTAGYRAAVRIDRRTKTGVIVLASVAGGKVDVGELSLTALETLAAALAPSGR